MVIQERIGGLLEQKASSGDRLSETLWCEPEMVPWLSVLRLHPTAWKWVPLDISRGTSKEDAVPTLHIQERTVEIEFVGGRVKNDKRTWRFNTALLAEAFISIVLQIRINVTII